MTWPRFVSLFAAVSMASLALVGVLVAAKPASSARPSPPARTAGTPGDVIAGLLVFKQVCAGCHNFQAAGIKTPNKTGTDLDARKPTFSQIVKLIVQGGGGGIESEKVLKKLSWEQIYDVAAFISQYAGKSVVLSSSSPLNLNATLQRGSRGTSGGSAELSGRFSGTLAGRTLRWQVTFSRSLGAGATGIKLQRSKGSRLIRTVCGPCPQKGKRLSGVTKLTAAETRALRSSRSQVVVTAARVALRGAIVRSFKLGKSTTAQGSPKSPKPPAVTPAPTPSSSFTPPPPPPFIHYRAAPGETYLLELEDSVPHLLGKIAVGLLDSGGNVVQPLSTAGIVEEPLEGFYMVTKVAPSTPGQYTIVWSLDGTLDPSKITTFQLLVSTPGTG